MFSKEEKRQVADEVERLLLKLEHPEMPKQKPTFILYVEGIEPWSFTEIKPNWMMTQAMLADANPWNESARDILKEKENK